MFDIQKLREKLGNLKTGGSNINWLKVKPGKTKLRILPQADEKKFFFEEAYFHSNLRTKEGGWTKRACPRKNYDEPCPFCDLVDKLRADSYDANEELIKKLYAKRRWFVNCLDVSKNDNIVYIWEFGITVCESLLNIVTDDQFGNIADPKAGRNITLTRTAEKRPTYIVMPDASTTPVVDFDKLSLNDLRKVAVPRVSEDDLKDLLSVKIDLIGKGLDDDDDMPSTNNESKSGPDDGEQDEIMKEIEKRRKAKQAS